MPLADLEQPAHQALLDEARAERAAAANAYDGRNRALECLAEQQVTGIWRSAALAEAIRQGRRDQALLRGNKWAYSQAWDNAHDLPIEYTPLLPPRRTVNSADLKAAWKFIDELRPEAETTELWLQALKLEAEAYLAQLTGDAHLRSAERAALAYISLYLREAGSLPPSHVDALLAYGNALGALAALNLPWRVEALYRRFLGRFPTPDPAAEVSALKFGNWTEEDRPAIEAWGYIADAVTPVLELRNPSDDGEIRTLDRLRTEVFAIADAPVEQPVVDLRDTTEEVLRLSKRSLKNVVRRLPAGSRPAAVLRAWQGLAHLGLNEFGELFELLEDVQPDDEALGILVRALLGEARYRMGRYEAAYLDLLRAEARAVDALTRRDPDRASWSPTERDALARLAQKAGNTLLAIGDEVKADEAFDRARELLAGSGTSHALDLMNQGNLLFLRNALDRDQGYMVVDRVLRKRLTEQGPAVLQEEKIRRHVASLGEAEKAYRKALELLPQPAAALRAACYLNLGNLAWAWAKVLDTEGAERLSQLPLGDGFEYALVSRESDGRACLLAAAEAYERARAELRTRPVGEGRYLLAAAAGNLSEVRYLAAGPGDRRLLAAALKDAKIALAAARSRARRKAKADTAGDARPPAARLPELKWQAIYNIARIKQALGDRTGAEQAYQEAIAAVEALRTGVRLDTWQALFLHDKMEVYEAYLGFLYGQDGETRAGAMFDVIEQTRSRAFLDLLARAQVRAAVPDELRERAGELLGRIAGTNEAIRAATLGDRQEEANRLLREQERNALKWADLQAEMADAQAHDEQLNPPRISLAETQARLGPGRVMLIYQLGERESHLLFVSADAAHAFPLPRRRAVELATLPVLFDCEFGTDLNAARFREQTAALSRMLLGPLDALGGAGALLKDKHMLVAPDGVLHYLPFEALFPEPAALEELPPNAAFDALSKHYLIRLATVSYIPSASAWRELSDRPREQAATRLLAVYDVRYDMGGEDPPEWAYPILMRLDSVPGARDVRAAIQQVRSAWPDDPIEEICGRLEDATPQADERQPTEQNFLRIAPLASARWIVFNGHAMHNDKHPSLSGLVFNLKPPAAQDLAAIPTDSFLRVDELFQLRLTGAEITFLAACQTALGAPYRGEGLNALLRAFMYQGSPAVVATLWAVDANAASWLVRRFFKLMAEQPQEDPARLFSLAKRASIGFDNRWLPFHWAPFIFAGGTR